MKTHAAAQKAVKSGNVTLTEAREAARAVRGERPTGTFLITESSKAKSLHDRFLGDIVHGPAKAGSSAHVFGPKRAAAKKTVMKKYARKK